VLIQGKSFPRIPGEPLGNYRVYVRQTGQLLPIRFQIDEMTEEGDLWDTRNYSAEALRTRVETFAAMLQAEAAA